MVDDADFGAVSQFKWHAQKAGRGFTAVRSVRKPDGKWTLQSLHNFLLPGVPRVDHRDGNRLNDQRGNLRPATRRQNGQGFRRKALGTTSKFRGVNWCRRELKWLARIRIDGRLKFLGYFNSEEDAARVYDAAARKYFGEFASPNFP